MTKLLVDDVQELGSGAVQLQCNRWRCIRRRLRVDHCTTTIRQSQSERRGEGGREGEGGSIHFVSNHRLKKADFLKMGGSGIMGPKGEIMSCDATLNLHDK